MLLLLTLDQQAAVWSALSGNFSFDKGGRKCILPKMTNKYIRYFSKVTLLFGLKTVSPMVALS